MTMTPYSTHIRTGADVLGSDGEKMGTVAAIYTGYLVVEKGFFFPTDYYVPMSAVASVDESRVYLNVVKDAALGSGWDVQPVDLETAEYDSAGGTYANVVENDGIAGNQPFAHDARPDSAIHRHGDEDLVIPVLEEELTATVREQQAGVARIEKNVVSEERTLDVPVNEERVRVERRVVDRPVRTADADAFQETVIDVPLTTETVDVQKQARVAEEVVVSKDAVQRTERVTDTVRKEEVFVDDATVAAETRKA